MTLAAEDRSHLLQIARDAVEAAIRGGVSAPVTTTAQGALAELSGAFVTLHVDGELRGCIGYVQPRFPLSETVARAAFAATQDDRFLPIRPAELPGLQIEISAMGPLSPITSDAVEVGVHGLVIECAGRSGLLLPQVPVTYGWDRVTYLEHLCRKARLAPEAWKRSDAQLHAFTADVFGEAPSQ